MLTHFLVVAIFGGPLASVGIMGVSMNLLSATCSLMPFKNMDGNKIYSYNKLYWALAFLPVLAYTSPQWSIYFKKD